MSENTTSTIEKNAQILEDLFFSKLDAEKIAELRRLRTLASAREDLNAVLPLGEDVDPAQRQEMLDDLINVGITAETVTALQLIPLVVVAWADGVLDEEERVELMKQAEEYKVTESEISMQLLEQWLEEKPGPELLQSWSAFISVFKLDATEATVNELRNISLSKAELIAASSGGFFGIGATNRDEQAVLQNLKLLF